MVHQRKSTETYCGFLISRCRFAHVVAAPPTNPDEPHVPYETSDWKIAPPPLLQNATGSILLSDASPSALTRRRPARLVGKTRGGWRRRKRPRVGVGDASGLGTRGEVSAIVEKG
ncbi:hypothetical protein GWI33_015174 [Rhynchophorus ferrugineus]|uniref:Uncharacterized protein n=1 Tax=Rhynchophorus ferrugineus TaxID=354439 RepID=A0A834M4S0_RHYFE|nr:hypothetical protein GWI33_015174 [Rhynchophorus ferrugineus]